jgi:hypothetical protein
MNSEAPILLSIEAPTISDDALKYCSPFSISRTRIGVISSSVMISPGAKSPVLAQTVTVLSDALLIMKAEMKDAMIKTRPNRYRGVKKKDISLQDFSSDFIGD